MKQVLFGIFKIYDANGVFLGISSGSLDWIQREWEPRGATRFDGGDTARLIDVPDGLIIPDGIVRPEHVPKGVPQEAPAPAPPPKPTPPRKSAGLARYVKDPIELEGHARAVVAAHPTEAERYRKGRTGLMDFFVAKVMARTQGGADPPITREALAKVLGEPSV